MNSAKTRKVVVNGHAGMANSVTRAWQERVPFDANGTLRADFTAATFIPYGRLNGLEAATLQTDANIARAAGVPLYVVYSYVTPIAWIYNVGGEEVVYKVRQKFSVTTSKHQGRLY